MSTTSHQKIQIKRDTLANWGAYNPVLALGEPALIIDTGELVIGNGSQYFASLPRIKSIDITQLATTPQLNDIQATIEAVQLTIQQNEFNSLTIDGGDASGM